MSGYLVIGAGGLGCPALLSLRAAGVARVTVVDHDVVEVSNLHRQVLYTSADVGTPKVEAARTRLRPFLEVRPLAVRVDEAVLEGLLDDAEPNTIVLECSDSPALKFLANDLCVRRGIPIVIAAALGLRGQALAVAPGSACYRCIYESPPPPELTPSCASAGVLGAAVGVLGTLQAHLALRLGEAAADASGRLFDVDLLTARVRELSPTPRAECPACGRPSSSRGATSRSA